MIVTTAAGAVVAGVLCLALAARALAARRLTFENKALMAVGWIVIIAVLAFTLTRVGA